MVDTNSTPNVSANVDAAIADAMSSQLTGKKWYASKTFWANVLAGAIVVVQIKYGFIVPPEYQMMTMTGINLILRKVTNTAITW